jgi:predicted enzyme related to lactoylglutathione lyase
VYLVARDADALARFYGEGLGLEVAFADPGRWVQFGTEGSSFCLAAEVEAAEVGDQALVPVFEVDDITGWEERLARAGGQMAAPVRDMGDHGRVFTGRDPEGHVFQLWSDGGKPG